MCTYGLSDPQCFLKSGVRYMSRVLFYLDSYLILCFSWRGRYFTLHLCREIDPLLFRNVNPDPYLFQWTFFDLGSGRGKCLHSRFKYDVYTISLGFDCEIVFILSLDFLLYHGIIFVSSLIRHPFEGVRLHVSWVQVPISFMCVYVSVSLFGGCSFSR